MNKPEKLKGEMLRQAQHDKKCRFVILEEPSDEESRVMQSSLTGEIGMRVI